MSVGWIPPGFPYVPVPYVLTNTSLDFYNFPNSSPAGINPAMPSNGAVSAVRISTFMAIPLC
jgi:hypothetical protein